MVGLHFCVCPWQAEKAAEEARAAANRGPSPGVSSATPEPAPSTEPTHAFVDLRTPSERSPDVVVEENAGGILVG